MYYYQNINVPVGDKLQERKKNLEQKVLLRGKSLTQTLKLCSKGNHQLPNNPEVKDSQLLKSFTVIRKIIIQVAKTEKLDAYSTCNHGKKS